MEKGRILARRNETLIRNSSQIPKNEEYMSLLLIEIRTSSTNHLSADQFRFCFIILPEIYSLLIN